MGEIVKLTSGFWAQIKKKKWLLLLSICSVPDSILCALCEIFWVHDRYTDISTNIFQFYRWGNKFTGKYNLSKVTAEQKLYPGSRDPNPMLLAFLLFFVSCPKEMRVMCINLGWGANLERINDNDLYLK